MLVLMSMRSLGRVDLRLQPTPSWMAVTTTLVVSVV